MRMTSVLIVFIGGILGSCTPAVSDEKEVKETIDQKEYIPKEFYVIQAALPLDFTELDFNNTSKRISISDGKESLIRQSFSEYLSYLGEAKALPPGYQPYIGSIWIKESDHDVYIVVFKHITGVLNTKIIIRNSYSNPALFLDYNIHAMYSFEEGSIKPTNLMKTLFDGIPLFKITTIDDTGTSLFELNRLYHNGTSNLMENFIFEVDNLNQLDTTSYSLAILE